MNRQTVELLLKEELRAIRGLSKSEAESLLANAMRDNIRFRLQTLKRLSPDGQFRMALAFSALDDANQKFQYRIYWLGKNRDRASLAEFFARAAGYIPAKRDFSALPLLPDDLNVLAYDLTILTEQTSKGSGQAQKRAKHIAHDLLAWRRDSCGIRHPEEYERPLSLQRAMFNARLMLELRLAGQTPWSLKNVLARGRIDVHKIINALFSPSASSALHDIDTANVCLSLLPTKSGERMALEYWKSLNRLSRRRMAHRLTRPDRVAAEARRQGPQKLLRSTVEMFLRSIGLRDHKSPSRLHKESFEDLLRNLGVKPTLRLWNCLLACRDTFHGCVSVEELQKRKARN